MEPVGFHWLHFPCDIHLLDHHIHPSVYMYLHFYFGRLAILFNEHPKPEACWSGRS